MIKVKLLSTVFFLFVFTGLIAQDIQITGKVTDSEGLALPGVTVLISGTLRGTATNIDGTYSIQASPDNTLEYSYIGYVRQVIPINNRRVIDVTMRMDYAQLDEVVVIGYGTVRKSDLTGSLVSLRPDDLNAGSTINVDQMLQGRAAGVVVYQNSAEPGGGLSIQIRGVGSINASNQPLYVVDGLPFDNSPVIAGTGEGFTGSRNPRNPLNSINPNDIESIEILKDASATAIYGSRGANGVILITTKKGDVGPLKVNYDAYYGTQQAYKTLDVMSAQDYQTVLNELYDAKAINANVGERVNEIQGNGTNWQNEVLRSAPVQNHFLTLTGGEGGSRYFASFNYYDQEGIVVNSGIKRYAARLNLEQSKSQNFKFGMNLNSSYVYDNFIPSGPVPNENSGVISSAIDFDPTLSIFDESTGRYNISPYITKDNPLALAYGKDAIAKTFNTIGTAYGEYFLFPELSFKLNMGGNIASSRRDVFIDSQSKSGLDAQGIGTAIAGLRYNYLAEATVNYNKVHSTNHRINLMAGATTQKFFVERINTSASGFISEATGTNSLQSGTQSTFSINTSSIPNTLLSFLARANYSYRGKYVLTTTIRADGSSRFGDNNKFGYFPSAALAWNIGNEPFIENLDVLSSLKLRVSWGRTGNQEIGNYNSLTTFSLGGQRVIWGDNQYVYYVPSRMPNPDLKWETTTQSNLGLDFGFLDGRLNGSFDMFYSKTTDLLLALPVPPQSGFNTRLSNVGSVENKGWEFNLTSYNLVGAFKWNTNTNVSVVKNKVLDLGIIDQIITGGLQFTENISIIKPGETLNSYYGYVVKGVWQTGDDFGLTKQGAKPGDLKYWDMNQDSLINANDRSIIGDPFPDFTWGMTNNFSYKGFGLSVAIQGVHGVDLLNNFLVHTYYPINFRRNKMAEPYLNRWTPDNPSNDYPSFINPFSQGTYPVNTKTVEDASYVRIQHATLSYNIPMNRVNAIKSLRLNVTATNLYTFTRYSGYDPGSSVNGTSVARIDYDAYPLATSILFGFNIGF
jgi:TonB-dependent starch-binding outer membrane protein SusC